ncbi:MAG TPA: sugar kinase [Burkholderiaceae bacterium]|nr:sugar kinase [Burkholderiaceae bacterium]
MSDAAAASERALDVVCLGEAMVEFNQAPGEPTRYTAGFGGDTSNCAIAAARIGARSGYITQVGDDVFGAQLLALWRDEGVDTGGVRVVASAETGLYFVTHDEHGHAFTYRRAGSAASRMACDDPAFATCLRRAGCARTLHVSGISQAISPSACDVVFAAIERARAQRARVSYDLNFRPRLWSADAALPVVRATVPLVDIFLPSIDEVALLAGTRTPEDALRWAHGLGAPIVVLKLGADGCWVSQAGAVTKVPPHRVTPVDATGAGDCFAGTLLARLAAGDDLVAAARAANVAAALSTQGVGAVAPLPRWPEVRAALAAAR